MQEVKIEGVKLKINGAEIVLSIEEVRKLYVSLKELLGTEESFQPVIITPNYPYVPTISK